MLSQRVFLDEYLFFLLTFEMRIPPVKLQEPCWKYNNRKKKKKSCDDFFTRHPFD